MVGVVCKRKVAVVRFAHNTNALASAQVEQDDCEWRQKAFVGGGRFV